MKLSEICVKRPVLSTVLSLIVVILGLVTWSQLPLRQYPLIEQPVVSVTTTYTGASPEIIEAQLTRPIENSLAGIEGIDFMESSSEVETSKVNIHFKGTRDIEGAANDVRDRLGRITLPPEADRPTISKADADASAIISLTLSSKTMPISELNDYATKMLQHQFESISGVASVQVAGGGSYQMHVYVDPIRMAAYGVAASDVAQAIKRQNLEKPAGRITSHDREILVVTQGRLSTAEQFNNLVVYEKNGFLVRIRDIGHTEMNAKEDRMRARFNGEPAVSLGIVKQSVANPLTIAKQLKEMMKEIQANLPTDTKLDIAYDRTVYIEKSIDQVYKTLWEATFLVVVVIFLFLGSFRASLVPLVTIPVSLIGAFTIIFMLNFSINVLTLLAMVLAIGLVVDDAIVVLENIHRHIEKGEKPFKAALLGVKEISFAVVAMTLTLAAVYAPIALSSGMTGKLFTEFALTLAGAVIISGLVALTLSPMMCSILLKRHQGKFALKTEHFQMQMEAWYLRTLKFALQHRKKTLAIGVAVSIAGGVLAKFMPSELLPSEDQSVVYTSVIPPNGATLEFVDRYVLQMEHLIRETHELSALYSLILLPSAHARVTLKPWDQRKRSSSDVADDLRKKFMEIPGVSINVFQPGSLGVGGAGEGSSIQFVIQTSRNYEELQKVTDDIIQRLLKTRGVLNLQNTLSMDGQNFSVKIDRDRASALNVDVGMVSETVDVLVSGRRVSKFIRDGKEYDVKLELEDHLKRSPGDIENIFVRSDRSYENAQGRSERSNVMVPLADLVDIKITRSSNMLGHFDQMRAAQISGTLAPKVTLGEVVSSIEQIAKDVFPKGMKLDWAGETRKFLQESRNILFIFGLALAFIYLVMAAQFESFVDPLIIMFSVPLSIAGGLLVLALAKGTLNLFSQIGLVTLIGLITKHGILIVDFANTRRDEGQDAVSAVMEGARLRLRPILMTTMAMVLGAIPLAMASGAGAESRQQIGLVIVGGMTLGTLFTLYVVPCVYSYLSRARKIIEH